jgi:hypothetical protein
MAMGVLTVLAAAVAIVGFGWEAREVVLGGAQGAVLWGAVEVATIVRPLVPRGTLPPLSADVGIEPLWTRRYATTLALVFPAVVPLGLLANRWQMGGLFFPGPFAGYAAAHLVGALLVARWQRRHDAVVIDLPDDDGDARLYARTGSPSAGLTGR